MDNRRLGFPVKVLAEPGLKSNDSRRWQSSPHLRVSLEYLGRIFDHLRAQSIRMYRMSSDLAPYVTHPDMPQFHGMIKESSRELRRAGERARALDIRLSFHPSQFIVLNSEDESLAAKSAWDLEAQAEMLELMELGPEAVVVVHTGGAYGDRRAGCERWIRNWKRLSRTAKDRLVLENDDLRYSPADVLWIHERTGVRLVFDYQHFWCFNPEGLGLVEALGAMLRTWPRGVVPKIHFSSPRTELREVERKDRNTGKTTTVLAEPLPTQHADYLNPFEFAIFMRSVADMSFDVMLESKAKDLALLRLRRDLLRFAPDVAAMFGIEAAPAASLSSGGCPAPAGNGGLRK